MSFTRSFYLAVAAGHHSAAIATLLAKPLGTGHLRALRPLGEAIVFAQGGSACLGFVDQALAADTRGDPAGIVDAQVQLGFALAATPKPVLQAVPTVLQFSDRNASLFTTNERVVDAVRTACTLAQPSRRGLKGLHGSLPAVSDEAVLSVLPLYDNVSDAARFLHYTPVALHQRVRHRLLSKDPRYLELQRKQQFVARAGDESARWVDNRNRLDVVDICAPDTLGQWRIWRWYYRVLGARDPLFLRAQVVLMGARLAAGVGRLNEHYAQGLMERLADSRVGDIGMRWNDPPIDQCVGVNELCGGLLKVRPGDCAVVDRTWVGTVIYTHFHPDAPFPAAPYLLGRTLVPRD